MSKFTKFFLWFYPKAIAALLAIAGSVWAIYTILGTRPTPNPWALERNAQISNIRRGVVVVQPEEDVNFYSYEYFELMATMPSGLTTGYAAIRDLAADDQKRFVVPITAENLPAGTIVEVVYPGPIFTSNLQPVTFTELTGDSAVSMQVVTEHYPPSFSKALEHLTLVGFVLAVVVGAVYYLLIEINKKLACR